nr:pentatricopeptide repeat-containing protein [Quercus suber]
MMAIVMMQRAKSLTCCPITLTFTFTFNWNSLCFHSAANIEDHQTLYRVLEACKHSFNSATATQTHARIIKFGYGAYPSLVAILISTYAHCHRLNLARRLIHQIFSWDFDLVSVNIVIERLMRIGECNFAKKVFDKMPTRDTVTWNSVIGGYVKNARFEEALTFFREMLSSNVELDAFTFASILTGCARLGALNHAYWVHDHMINQTLYRVLEACKHSFNSATATQTHARIIKFGYGAYPSLVAILISTYAHCHRLNLARRLIHQIFSWDFDLVEPCKSILLTKESMSSVV